MGLSRKNFIKTTGLGVIALGTAGFTAKKSNPVEFVDPSHKLRIGLASYTLRKYSLDEVVDILIRFKLTDVAFKSFHLPFEASEQ